MISVILYGRNDNYGYNLHKRAVISINTLAVELTDPTDEIVFVDYNSPDELPTFPEAVHDLFTEQALRLLRVIRVRNRTHRLVRRDSALQLRECLARNIGIRRANPENRWILSTNPDMVFLSRQGKSLSQVVAELPDGYYSLPRFEVPESLWESVDRMAPHDVRATFAVWGRELALEEIVTARDYQGFDAPGDFQLFPRQAAEAISGFNERMIYGWHVDSNLCKRMALYFGGIHSLADAIAGYHCDHTRLTSAGHAANRTENNYHVNCDELTHPDLPEQAETWGMPECVFEEIRFEQPLPSLAAQLREIVDGRQEPLSPVPFVPASYNGHAYYNTVHAFPYVASQLATLHRATRLAYLGSNSELLRLLHAYCGKAGFNQAIVYQHALMTGAGSKASAEIPGGCLPARQIAKLAEAEFFLIDTFLPPETAIRNRHGNIVMRLTVEILAIVMQQVRLFLDLALREQRALQMGCAPRTFLVMGVQNSLYEDLYSRVVGFTAVPFSCHYRHGVVRQEADIESALAILTFLDELGRDKLAGLCAAIRDICEAPADMVIDFAAAFDRMELYISDGARLDAWCARGINRSRSLPFLACILLYALAGRFTEASIVYAKFWKDASIIPDRLLSAAGGVRTATV